MIYAKQKHSEDKSKLIRDNIELVDILVGRMATQVPAFMNRDDMRSAGLMGLIDAANKFDTSKNILFKTFAEYRIRGAIFDEMRKLDWFSRTLRDKQSRVSKTMSSLENKLGRDPSEEEMAGEMKLGLEEYQNLLGQVSHLGCVSLHEALDNSGEGRQFIDELVDESKGSSPVDILENSEVTAIIADILGNLPEKERLVISLYYYEELTQKEIAEVLGVSEGRISQLHSQALINLKNKARTRLH
ncbi:FliA/WhiG family RNA polymerase sigma factor [Desulfopila inferna]|uniref:FliA/WhiG family RNA polymerase sigma factor n=1 Tax=Desulfopila inferna TaxID=468528 RepID=UPI001965D595|nr:FliA/WhiG family RNA polymerase sigma factor [Desulfopila inferna]MBM9602991.1 FliA/WhiG family RNA polymerase sigma factor [Desulfopila inferna]